MRDFNQKKIISSFILIFLISILGIFVFKVNNVHAGLIDFSIEVVAKGLSYLGIIVRAMCGLIFSFAALLLEIAFGLEKFANAPIVQTGWQLTRDLVNMLFVLVLLVIAFGAILQIEGYGIKKLLPKLIIVALLINFSLVICGTIIDASQVAAHFFYDEVAGNKGITLQLASALQVQKVYQIDPNADLEEKLPAGISGSINTTFAVFAGALLILGAAIALGLGAFFLLTRLIMLWILLIMSPLAWFAGILPGTSGYTSQWWRKFLNWAFFAPVYFFFVWLAIQAAQFGSFNNIIQQEANNVIASSGLLSAAGIALLSIPSAILQFLCIIGLLIGGVMWASKMGAYGASGTMSFVKNQGGSLSDWAGKRAKTFTAPWAEKMEGRMQEISTVKGPSEGKLRRLGRWTVGQTARAPRAYVESERADVKKAKERYKSRTTEHLYSDYMTSNLHNRVGIADELADRGKFDLNEGAKKMGFSDKYINQALKESERYGMQDNLLKSNLKLAEKVGKKPIEILRKMKPADMNKISIESITDENGELIKDIKNGITELLTTQTKGAMNKNHLSELNKSNYPVFEKIQKEIIEKEIMSEDKWKEIERIRPDITKYISGTTGKSLFGEVEWLVKEKKKEKRESKINTSPTQEDFLKAKAEGYKGK
ncbi:hypothetical protein ACFLZ0_02335 [Patescibacteria group bacterium]